MAQHRDDGDKMYVQGLAVHSYFTGTWNRELLSGAPTSPNDEINSIDNKIETFEWSAKFFGNYMLPYDFQFGWNLIFQSGTHWARRVRSYGYYDDPVNLTGYHRFNQGTVSLYREKWGTRQRNIVKVPSLRLIKVFNIPGGKLSAIFQLFDGFNANNAENSIRPVG